MIIRQSFDERFMYKISELKETYGEEIFKIAGISDGSLDINQFAKKFFRNKKSMADISIDKNGNVDDTSILSFEYEFSKSFLKLNAYYLLWSKMVENPKFGIKRANKILDLCISGALKIHDLHFFLKPYCYAFSMAPIMEKGLPFVKKVKIGPPKHLFSYVNLTIQFVSYASNQIAGAVGLPDFFIYADYLARKDYGENYLDTHEREVGQHLQSLIFSFNFPFRGSQSAFVNLSVFDDAFLKSMFSNTYYPDLSQPNFESIKKLQKFYMKTFIEQSKQQSFTFPVNTATFYKNEETGEIEDQDFLNYVSEMNSYNGAFNIYNGPLSSLSSCCRLRSSFDGVKREYMNSFGSAGVSIGSARVVTVNLPRIAYMSQDQATYMKLLDYNVNAAQDILEVHREVIQDNIERGKLPLYTFGFMYLDKQYMTTGFIGMNEACEMMGLDIATEVGSKFGKSILDKINELNTKRTKIDGHIRNVEQIPGESAAVDLAQTDNLLFNSNDSRYVMYSNQFIPLWKNVDVHERIRLQGIYDNDTSGGSILHINLDSSITPEQMKRLIQYSASKGVVYFAVNMAQCRCVTCGKLYVGKFDKSPCHNADVLKYLRVVGFMTEVSNWIPERREEYNRRQFYGDRQVNVSHETEVEVSQAG